jgi:hypothetical protein
LREAVQKVRPQMDALEPDDLLTINLDPLAAASTALGALPRILPFRRELLGLPGFDIKHLDNLETYALASTQTQTVFLGSSMPPERLADLVDEATRLREQLLSDATALAHRGLLNSAKLSTLKGSVGFRNVASDVLTLANMIRGNWATVSGKTGVTEVELDRAEIIGDRLINDIGVREQAPAAAPTAAVERQKAYTLFIRAYDQLRRGMIYLRWNEGDADDIAPSLYGGRKRKSGSEIEETPVIGPTGSTGTAGATGATGATGTQTSTQASPTLVSKPSIGMPGSDPFVQ